MMLKTVKDFFLDLVFPSLCLGCDQHLEAKNNRWPNVCDACFTSLSVNSHIVCPVCANRIFPEALQKERCHPTAYRLLAAADYNHPAMKKMLWQFKYEGWQGLKEPLAQLLIRAVRQSGGDYKNWLIVPIPLHPYRQRERGFNQSELLAAEFNKEIGFIWLKNNLVRDRYCRPQMEIDDFSEREKNMTGVFSINDPEKFRSQNIILIDDIFTSGATIGEATRILKLAGAKNVLALVVAKAR